jgi:regulator of sirC expression with transglutaminase-like and TPR domain
VAVFEMIDRVLERRRGLTILLSAVYIEVARRAGVSLADLGLPGHYVVGHSARPSRCG